SVTEKVADVPLNFTLVVPVKFVPVIVTFAPTSPLVGEKLLIVGAGNVTVKLFAEVALPRGVTAATFPVTALVGTVAVTLVALTTENVVAATPPIETEVAPVRFVPVTVMEVPVGPLAGVKLLIVGVAGGGGVLLVPLTAPPHPENIAAPASIRPLIVRE